MAKSQFTQPTANQQVLRKIRASKPKATVVEPVAEPVAEASEETLFERMRASADAYFAKIGKPTWVRQLVSIGLGLITYGTVFYACMGLVDALCMAAIAYSGIGFISFMVAFLGILASLLVASTAGKFVYDTAMAFEWSQVKARCVGWFDKLSIKREEVNHA